jgi:hypothetical protein
LFPPCINGQPFIARCVDWWESLGQEEGGTEKLGKATSPKIFIKKDHNLQHRTKCQKKLMNLVSRKHHGERKQHKMKKAEQ